MDLSLVIMAAGLGSRFGGTKQLVEVGPNGEAFLDFAIKDGRAAGCHQVVLIIRSDIEADVRAVVRRRTMLGDRQAFGVEFMAESTEERTALQWLYMQAMG